MKTQHRFELEERFKEDNKQWVILVENFVGGTYIETLFKSQKGDTLHNALHKIYLDLMTNLHYNFENPVKISIKEIK